MSRFNPQASDSQLLIVLRQFVTGENHYGHITGDIDGRPWKIFSGYDNKNTVYFFCRRQRKANNTGKRFSRRRSTAWHGTDKGKVILDEQSKRTLGVKKRFLYKNRYEPEHDGRWLLQEFCLAKHVIRQLQTQGKLVPERKDCVLCRLKRKGMMTRPQPCDRINGGDEMELEARFADMKIREDDDRAKRTSNRDGVDAMAD